jgi:acetyl esterase/lipase
MPKYRKMPESHGREILNDADIFWEWYQSRQFYLDLQTLFLGSGTNRTDVNTKIDRHQLFVSGESAGGFLAAYSWLSQPDLRIEALYMQYPMLRAYTRRSGEPYRGKVIPEHEVQEYAKVYCDHITALKALDKINPRTDSVPPEGMDMAYMFSSAKKEVIMNGKKTRISYWKWWFRQPDILERLEELVNRAQDTQAGVSAIVQEDAPVPGTAQRQTSQPTKAETETPTFTLPKANHAIPSYCPPMFISHGIEDTNCPAQDTQEFMRLVKQLFPEASIRLELRPEQAHGFDYTLDEWDLEQRWLLQLCIAIASAWIPGDAVETAAIRSCRPSPSPSEDVSLPDFPPGSGSIEGPTSASQSVTLRDTDSEGPGRGDSTEADRTLLTPDSAGLAGATPSSEDTSMCSHGGRSGNTRNEL